MTTEHLTDDERATFLLGQAMRRAMIDTASIAPEIRAQAWAAYAAMLDHVLSPEDAKQVTRTTGLIDLSPQWADYAAERNGVTSGQRGRR
jgi:hypothetical protein